MIGRQALASVLVVLVVVSSVAGVGVAGLAGASSSAPAGFESVPDQATSNDVPTSQSLPGAAALTDSVAVNRSAETTSVSVTTEAAAQGVVSECSGIDQVEPAFCSEPRLALNISDDQRHQGREVAVPRQALVDAVGEVPETVFGVNSETGKRWEASTTVRDGYVVFSVPHFSTNTVTFAGEVQISGNPAASGTQWTYNLESIDNVGNFSVTLTGSENRHIDTVSETHLANGDAKSYTVDGTTSPEQETVSMTGRAPLRAGNQTHQQTGGSSKAVQWLETSGDTVYSAQGDIFAYNFETEAREWSYTTSSNAHSLFAAGSTLYGGLNDGTLLSLSQSDGSKNWETAAHSNRINQIATDGSGTIFTASEDGTVRATADSDQSQVWSNSESDAVSGVDYHSGTVYYTVDTGEVYAVDATDGSVQWSVDTSSTSMAAAQATSDGVFYVDRSSQEVVALDPADGSEIWRVSTGSSSTWQLDARNGRLVHAAADLVKVKDADDGDTLYLSDRTGTTSDSAAFGANGDSVYQGDRNGGRTEFVHEPGTYNPSISIDGTTVLSHSGILDHGDTVSSSVSLSLGSNQLDISTDTNTRVDTTLEFEEITESVDPAVEVNGNWANHTGTLADGSTTSLAVDSAWLRDGTNMVNVSVAPSVSTDAPTPQVGIDYQHDADDLQNISFASEQWTERYNVSKTYAGDRKNAYLNISHPSNVVSVRDLEVRWNESGGWSSVASSNYQLTGNDLSVDLSAIYPSGSTIPATSTVEVRLNASKVQPHNMTIEVLEASDVNSELYSKIRFKSLGANAHLDVGPTDEGSRVHHLLDESWSAPSEYVVIDASGAQKLYVPGATAGDTARVTNISAAVTVTNTTGDVQVGVESGGEEPTLDISPGPGGSGDSIELKYYRTTSGAEYALYSVTNGIIRDTDVAESPAILSDDDSNELLEITLESSGGSGGGSGGGGGAGQFVRRSTGGLPLGLIAVVGLLVVGVGFVVLRSSGRSSTSSRRGSGLTGRLSSGLSSWLSKPLTLAGLAAVALVGLVLTGALQVPSGTGVLLMVTGIPLVAYVALRSVGQYSTVAFGVVSLIAVVVGLQILGAEVVRALVEQLGPSIPLLALGGLYLAYKGVKAARAPEEKNEITLDVDGGDDGGGS